MKLGMWLDRSARRLTAAIGDEPELMVWLDPFHAPVSSLERRVFSHLAAGPLRLSELVECLAADHVWSEHRVGTWSLDVGAQALPHFRAKVREQLEWLDGGQIAMETPPTMRAQALASWQLGLCA